METDYLHVQGMSLMAVGLSQLVIGGDLSIECGN